MSKFKAGDTVIRVRNGEHMGCSEGDVGIVDSVLCKSSFTLKGYEEGSFDPDSFELLKSSDGILNSVNKAKELRKKIFELQKELDEHLLVMTEFGIQFIEGATDVA